MAVFTIGDLHLSFDTPNKSMDPFGPLWINHPARVKEAWLSLVKKEDLVLIPGDISWAKKVEGALADLKWIDDLPGTKVLIRGNHDYWWASLSKLNALGLKTVHFLHNSAYTWGDVTVAGARLWDSTSYNCQDCFVNPMMPRTDQEEKENEAIFQRELVRLEESLKAMDQKAPIKIAMTHYPPTNPSLDRTVVTDLLEKYGVQFCLFGHLHSIREDKTFFGAARGVQYILTSCDFLRCTPLKII